MCILGFFPFVLGSGRVRRYECISVNRCFYILTLNIRGLFFHMKFFMNKKKGLKNDIISQFLIATKMYVQNF